MDLIDGILDDGGTAEAIAQQSNCIGTECQGLAVGLAIKYPYGCPYGKRRRMPLGKFAVSADRPWPGSIDVRHSPAAVAGPTVINMFAQWELVPGAQIQPHPSATGRRGQQAGAGVLVLPRAVGHRRSGSPRHPSPFLKGLDAAGGGTGPAMN